VIIARNSLYYIELPPPPPDASIIENSRDSGKNDSFLIQNNSSAGNSGLASNKLTANGRPFMSDGNPFTVNMRPFNPQDRKEKP
jgi:hypothetical protein